MTDDVRPEWKRTRVHGGPHEAFQIDVKAGSTVPTSEGVFEFEREGSWILMPMDVWLQTLRRLRAADARASGKGDGGRKAN